MMSLRLYQLTYFETQRKVNKIKLFIDGSIVSYCVCFPSPTMQIQSFTLPSLDLDLANLHF